MQRERHIDNSGSAFALPDQDAVLIAGAEIHIGALDLVALEAEELGIPELLPTLGQAFIGDKSLVAFDQDFFELMPLDPVGDAPAARKIRRLVDLVIIWPGEAKVVSERIFYRLAVVRQVAAIH